MWPATDSLYVACRMSVHCLLGTCSEHLPLPQATAVAPVAPVNATV
jgi:hypothetical protein